MAKSSITLHSLHMFEHDEAALFRSKLLQWYKINKRDLLWRQTAKKEDAQQRAYAVLVSEIMLQQTQVVTVEQYYKKWMTRWPTFQDLAAASLEEVNEMWSGLGYYARGRRLFEAAKKVVGDLDGKLPQSAAQLQEQLPGVGRYTAGAVASIAFGERVAAVDGNVIRVLARLRLIGGDSSAQGVMKDIWNIAEALVDPKEPGSFNEAMMELGATICTPKTPNCSTCPVKNLCLAYNVHKNVGINKLSVTSTSQIPDIETVADCKLCLPSTGKWDPSLGVKNYPRKAKKTPPRNENVAVCILYRKTSTLHEEEYFLVKRPAEGLLANLWEFPSFLIQETSECNVWKVLKENLNTYHGIKEKELEHSASVGEVTHLFSHIHQVNLVYAARVKEGFSPLTSERYQDQQWMSNDQLISSAVSSAVRKIYKKYHSKDSNNAVSGKCDRSSSTLNSGTEKKRRKNSVLTDFYSVKSNLCK